jgi:hypothetical protein
MEEGQAPISQAGELETRDHVLTPKEECTAEDVIEEKQDSVENMKSEQTEVIIAERRDLHNMPEKAVEQTQQTPEELLTQLIGKCAIPTRDSQADA